MKHEITLSWPGGGESFSAQDGQTLLDAALAAGIPLENSCRRGDCGQCRAEMDAPEGEGGLRDVLLCQTPAQHDTALHLDEDPRADRIPARVYPVKVVALDRLSPDIVGLAVVTPRNQVLAWRAGQYATVKLPDGTARHYSIAGVDPETRRIDFHIKLVQGGAFGGWLSDVARVGDMLQIEAPHGRFCWRGIRVAKTLMYATGTGIVPLMALLSEASDDELAAAGRVELVWGNRHVVDAYAADRLTQLAERRGFDVRMIFSREREAKRVTDLARDTDMSDVQIFAAGHPQMVNEMRALALSKGVPKNRIHLDAFTFGR